ncbi:MAG: phosphoribosylanthranilate isomerase [Desulfobacterales bacterium]|nr:phosphoribosylanthranilate isomerase [Desulfobacterales bacterium]
MTEKQVKWQPVTSTRPLVKICGLTRVDNALDCVRAGADMIGLVFFKKSPRNLSLSQAREIVRALPDPVLTCGVFVDAGYDEIMETAENTGFKAAQLHGSESPELAEKLSGQGLVVIKAFFAARMPGLSMAEQYPAADFCLAEYGKGILPGGNAEAWDYGMASDLNTRVPLMLAGGLTPENVGDAVSRTGPAAVDASSGVEKAPGIKEVEKVKAFIRAAKA